MPGSRHNHRLAAALAIAASLVLAPAGAAPALAQGSGDLDQVDEGGAIADYALDSDRWNGLSTLSEIARGFGLRVEAYSRLDWTDLGADDILFILYPIERVEPGHLSAFVRNGGRVLVADDFGNSAEALAKLGMLHESGAGVSATRFYRDLPYAPIATPIDRAHPLAAGVDELATNHPAVLRGALGAEVVFGFGPGEGVVATGGVGGGTGRFVVVSDPSVFINRMLSFAGNLKFAINVLRYLNRPGQTARLVILAGEFSMYGEPEDVLERGGSIDNMMADFNRWLDERNDYLLTGAALEVLAVIGALLLALLVLAAVPMVRRTNLDGDWTRAAVHADEAAEYERVVEAYEDDRRAGNYLLPATFLRDTLQARLARALDTADPLYMMSERQLMVAVGDRYGDEAVRRLMRIYPGLRPLPSRLQAASALRKGYVSRRDFERLRRGVAELDRALDRAPPA